MEELAVLLENAAVDDDDEDENCDDDVFYDGLPGRNAVRNMENTIEGNGDSGEEEDVDPEDDWHFDQIMAFFDWQISSMLKKKKLFSKKKIYCITDDQYYHIAEPEMNPKLYVIIDAIRRKIKD